jgi:orotate phosphoribosyltransferase
VISKGHRVTEHGKVANTWDLESTYLHIRVSPNFDVFAGHRTKTLPISANFWCCISAKKTLGERSETHRRQKKERKEGKEKEGRRLYRITFTSFLTLDT